MNISDMFPQGQKLPNEQFTGNAFLTPLVAKDKNNGFSVGSLKYEPKTRSNWHTHPKGQVLIIIEGNGFFQEKGKPARAIKKGDAVNAPENVEHWHGASATSKMVDIAITNYKGDEQVTWLKLVAVVNATTIRYNGMINDFGMLNGLANEPATKSLIMHDAAKLKYYLG